MPVRVYLPVTLDELRASPRVRAPRAVHAVTPALRAQWPDEDDEGWEYAAQAGAADGALALLAGDPQAARLRVVASADVPDSFVRTFTGAPVPSMVELVQDVDLSMVVCVHVDEPAAAPDVAAAAAGDAAAAERLEDHDLLWYDVTEIAQIPVPGPGGSA